MSIFPLHKSTHVLGRIGGACHQIPDSHRHAVVVVMIQIRGSQAVKELMTDHSHIESCQVTLDLNIVVIDPFPPQSNNPVINRPLMRPEDIIFKSSSDHEDHVIDLAIVIGIEHQISGNQRTDAGYCIFHQGKFPFSALSLSLVARILAIVRPGVRILPRDHISIAGRRIEGGIDG